MNKLISLLVFALCASSFFGKATAETSGGVECVVCVTVAELLEDWMEQNKTLSEIETALDIVCKFVPSYQRVCDAIVDLGVEEALSIIEQESPQALCQTVGMCSSSAADADFVCASCEAVMSAIENWVASNRTEATIDSYVDELFCQFEQFKQVCDAIVNAELPVVIQWVEQKETPTVICQQMTLCASSSDEEISILSFVN